jgi:hypothetical protein
MADHATLTHCLVLVNEWPALLRVALEASFVSAQESKATALERLLNICRCGFDSNPGMRVVTIAAAHLSFQDWMMMRQLECRANFQVTLKTSFRRLTRIDDRTSPAAGFNVQTPRAMARLAAHALGVLAFCLETRMRCGAKIAHDLFVAGPAFLCANELRAWNAGRRKNGLIRRAARKQNHGERGCSPDAPKQPFALTVDPSS